MKYIKEITWKNELSEYYLSLLKTKKKLENQREVIDIELKELKRKIGDIEKCPYLF